MNTKDKATILKEVEKRAIENVRKWLKNNATQSDRKDK